MKKVSSYVLYSMLIMLTACGGGNTIPETTLPNITNKETNISNIENSGNNSETKVTPNTEEDGKRKFSLEKLKNKNFYSNDILINNYSSKKYSFSLILDSNNNLIFNNSLLNGDEKLETYNFTFTSDDFKKDKNNIIKAKKTKSDEIINNNTISLNEYMNLFDEEKENLKLPTNVITKAEIAFGGESVNLDYTDFGYLYIDTKKTKGENIISTENKIFPFIIYDDKKERLTPEKNMIFVGKTFASVSPISSTDKKYTSLSGNAKLEILDVKEDFINKKLSLEFDNWYNLTYYYNENNDINVDIVEGKNFKSNGYNHIDSPLGTLLTNKEFENIIYEGKTEPEEAIGTFSYGEIDYNFGNSLKPGWILKGSFGAKRVNK